MNVKQQSAAWRKRMHRPIGVLVKRFNQVLKQYERRAAIDENCIKEQRGRLDKIGVRIHEVERFVRESTDARRKLPQLQAQMAALKVAAAKLRSQADGYHTKGGGSLKHNPFYQELMGIL